MAEFHRWLNYYTIFGGTVDDANVWGGGRIGKDACYRGALNRMSNRARQYHSILKIKLFNTTNDVVNGNNNCCFLTQHQVVNYLRQLASIYPFKYKVTTGTYGRQSTYVIDLDLTATRAVSTFILQSIKKLYEFPQNFYIQEAYKMQHMPKFRFTNIQNLFMAVASSYERDPHRDHCFAISCKFRTKKQISEKLKSIQYVDDLFDACTDNATVSTPTYSTELMTSDTNFNKQLALYEFNYHKLKQ